jgi:hypothetical protein
MELERVALPLAGARRAGRAAERVESVQRVALLLGVPADHAVTGHERLAASRLDVNDEREESVEIRADVECSLALVSVVCGEPWIISSPIHFPASARQGYEKRRRDHATVRKRNRASARERRWR